jgi:hypothetical protein
MTKEYAKQLKSEIREAYVFLRTENNSIPSDTLDFILEASIEKVDLLLAESEKK